METEDSIYFYGHNNLHGYMSNFYPSNFVDTDGNNFSCSEQYLMYIKAKTFEPTNNILLNTILNETNPVKIKKYGRMVKNYDENTWNNIRYDVMKSGLRLKFTQNLDLKNLLIGTGTKTLYEASPYDKIWGIGFSPKNAPNVNKYLFGRNLLGNALMEIRDGFK
jgi:ribA/ribD-fused uncharacterized protein